MNLDYGWRGWKDWWVRHGERIRCDEVAEACRANFAGRAALRARLLAAPKYGNHDPLADGFVGRVMEIFAGTLRGEKNTRGGEYAAGFHSVTSHHAWGEIKEGMDFVGSSD